MVETKMLANYTLDIVDITEFRDYLKDNIGYFSPNAVNAYLKALDIPPKFFKEQPKETQEELLDNREVFVRETKKFFNKVIVVVKYISTNNDVTNIRILGAARLDRAEANNKFAQLSSIDDISNKFEHRSFVKDGYISIIVSNGIEKNKDNQVLAVDFPINLNKRPVIHRTLYRLPDSTFATPVEHLQYLDSTEVDLGVSYNTIKEAIDDQIDFLDEERDKDEIFPILREVEVVALALQELGTIPKSYTPKIEAYIEKNIKGELNNKQLESFVLDFDETLKSYKQVTNLRSVSGNSVIEFLNSPQFQELEKEMDEVEMLEL